MALTLTVADLTSAIRLGDSAEEVAEATRLLAFVIEAISRHLGAAYEDAPEVIVNEAGIRLAGYLFDQPNAGRGLSLCQRREKFGRLDDPSTVQNSPGRVPRAKPLQRLKRPSARPATRLSTWQSWALILSSRLTTARRGRITYRLA